MTTKRNRLTIGFTIVELIVVISIIGILSTIVLVSYKTWQNSIIVATLRNDLNGAASAMENSRTFNNLYPSTIPTTLIPSKNITLTGGSADSGKTYCIDAVSSENTSLHYYTDSLSSTTGAKQGTCAAVYPIPANLIAVVTSDTSINVSWDAVTGATSYTLQRDTNSSFTSPTIITQAGITFASIGLSPGMTYYYRVQAKNAGVTSGWSNVASAGTTNTIITIPTNLVATTASSTSINVSWNTVSGATSYTLHRDTNSSFPSPTIVTQAGITYLSSSLSQGITYYYRVQATGATGTSGWSTTANATTTIDTPAAPVVTATAVYPITTTWSWTTPTCPSGTIARYQYEYTITPSGYDSGWVATASSPVAFTTSTIDQTYTVQVQAQCYTTNTTSTWSASSSASYYRGHWKQIAVGDYHNCGIASNDLAYCWGDNEFGNLGINSTTDSLIPVAVNTAGVLSGKTIKSIALGHANTCVIASDNLEYCWGWNDYGQVGDNSSGTNRLVPVAVNTAGVLSGKTIKSIAVGHSSTCAIASDNLEYCWGHNAAYGKLGNNSTADFLVPVAVYTAGVLSGKTILSITIGGNHTCAIASDNNGYCWGMNTYGEVGNNAMTDNQVIPAAVYKTGALSGLTLKSIEANDSSSCAIASNDQAYCWGWNQYGQLGNNSTTTSSVPVTVYTAGVLSGKTISSLGTGGGYYHNCAIASDNKAYCWGYNNHGQLGINSADANTHSVPVGPILPP